MRGRRKGQEGNERRKKARQGGREKRKVYKGKQSPNGMVFL